MAIYLFSQILKITQYSITLIENLSRRHLINSSDVFVIKGFTVRYVYIDIFSFMLKCQISNGKMFQKLIYIKKTGTAHFSINWLRGVLKGGDIGKQPPLEQ